VAELAPQLEDGGLAAAISGDGFIESKVSHGGTALPRVLDQLREAQDALREAGP